MDCMSQFSVTTFTIQKISTISFVLFGSCKPALSLCLLHSNGLLPLSTQTAEWLESAKEQYRVIFPCRDVGVNTCRHMHHPAPSCSIQQYPVLFLAPCRSEAFELGKNCACSDVGLFRCVACFWLQKSLVSSLDKSAKRTYQRIQLTPIVKRTLIH